MTCVVHDNSTAPVYCSRRPCGRRCFFSFLTRCFLTLSVGFALQLLPAGEAAEVLTVVETSCLRLAVGSDARVVEFVDRQRGENCVAGEGGPCAWVRKANQQFPATSAALVDGQWHVRFGDLDMEAVLRVTAQARHLTWEVVSFSNEDIDEFVFCDVPLKLQGVPTEPFAAIALALNLKTRVAELPRAASRLRATCYPKFGCAGAAVAIVATPPADMRAALQEAVSAAPELPHSPLGGPWALDAPINRGSYLFDFAGITEAEVDEWIALARSLGMTQISFHSGSSIRFGDFQSTDEFSEQAASPGTAVELTMCRSISPAGAMWS